MRWNPHLAPRGIRARTTVSATLVVAMTLLVASGALLLLQRQQLIDGLTSMARQGGDLIVAEIEEGGLDEVDLTAVKASSDETLLQVLDASGAVLMTNDDDYAEHAITEVAPAPGETEVRTVNAVPEDDGEDAESFVIVVSSVDTSDGSVRVVTAQSLDAVQRSTTVLMTLLAVGVPLVLMVVAATTYRVVGRALAPVEDIRAQVARVSTADQDARVPVPKTGDEIERLAHTMNGMLTRLHAAATAQHRFVADASHELRSPLATIRASTELASSHPEAMGWAETAETILTETNRLERLVADLLLLARSDEAGLIMRMQDVDLDDIVTDEVSRLRAAGVVDLVVDVRSVRVRGDTQHLVRAVHNLTDNAARHATSRVQITLRVLDDQAQLEVIDDGPGIPTGDEERVFERFVRLDASRQRGTGGTGLGLAITRQIARAHGGDVRVLPPQDGVGARLRLTLPLPQTSGRGARVG